MKLYVLVLLCLIHASCGSLLEEDFDDEQFLLQRTRKDSQNPDSKVKCMVSGFDVVQDLDLGKLHGDWYEAFRTVTSVLFRSGVWRFQATTQTNISDFMFAAKLMNNECMPPIQGSMDLSDSKPSAIKMRFRGLKGNIEEEFEVMHTDYKNLLVLYSCLHLLTNGQCSHDASVLIILSRHRSMSQPVLDNMKQWADKACIGLDALIQQDSIRSCNLDQLDHERWKDSHTASEFACKKVAPCTVACPPCCEEREDGCIHCQCWDTPQGEGHIEPQKQNMEVEAKKDDDCVLNLKDCPGSNCQLVQKRPGCNVCNCGTVLRSPPMRVTHVKTISDVRECPTSCRTKIEHEKLLCDCSNKEICQPIPPNVPLSCRDQEERYYFDDRTGTCHAFYGSCLDGPNNFKTLNECIRVCAEVCELPLDPGRCRTDAPIPVERYYFNRIRGVCDLFNYGGCGGNANNFETIGMCKHQCPEWMEDSYSNRRPDRCYQHPVKGNCAESQIRYFFLNITKTCTSFFYSGCGKGPNHFESLEECESICSGNTQQAPKQCPDIGNCPCPTEKQDDCLACPCKTDSEGDGQGDSGMNNVPCVILLLASFLWLRWHL